MTETTEKIIIGLSSGVIGGFALPYLAKTWETLRRAKRIKSALTNEITCAKKEIEFKLEWLYRDVSAQLKEVDETRIVDYNGKKLYLGEDEAFTLKCKYWEDRYNDIVEILRKPDFSYYATIHQLISNFVKKFGQMKAAFSSSIGDSKLMALACYKDLVQIDKEIEQQIKKASTK